MTTANQWDQTTFPNLCRDVMRGLGLGKPQVFQAKGIEQSFRVEVSRVSKDGMFRTKETWLCLFERKSLRSPDDVLPWCEAAIAADANYLLAVVFGEVTPEVDTALREVLASEKTRVVLLTNPLSEGLAADYSDIGRRSFSGGFSFSRLRRHAQDEVQAAPWRSHFQAASILPTRLTPLHAEDVALAEADLFRAATGGSFLLLGEPGAGKTTSLKALADSLAKTGGLMPVFVPMGRYEGNFWRILCEALSPGTPPIHEATARALVESGILVLLLDGLNEVQDRDLHAQLVQEINRLTAPDAPAARSLWIVTGRVHDYQQSHYHLMHLESRRWEMQPLTADLIFQLLSDALGQAMGKDVYERLGPSIHEICSNPLLLTMVLAVQKETGSIPFGRGNLYQRFVDLLLRWGDDWGLGETRRKELARLLLRPLTAEYYAEIAQKALVNLADTMPTTMLRWGIAKERFAFALAPTINDGRVAELLLEDLTDRGLLRLDWSNRVSFFHHTIQEFYKAFRLLDTAPDVLIPIEGIYPADRESIVFVAGLLPDAVPLLQRAQEVDLQLCLDILWGVNQTLPGSVSLDIARGVWINSQGGMFIGSQRRFALQFCQLAIRLGKTIEELVDAVESNVEERPPLNRAARLSTFYAELGERVVLVFRQHSVRCSWVLFRAQH